MAQIKKDTPVGMIYVLWAEYTDRFKVGYTADSVDARAYDLETASPFPLRILAEMPGRIRDERNLHYALREFRVHREWFSLPEPVVWQLMQHFGVPIPEGVLCQK